MQGNLVSSSSSFLGGWSQPRLGTKNRWFKRVQSLGQLNPRCTECALGQAGGFPITPADRLHRFGAGWRRNPSHRRTALSGGIFRAICPSCSICSRGICELPRTEGLAWIRLKPVLSKQARFPWSEARLRPQTTPRKSGANPS